MTFEKSCESSSPPSERSSCGGFDELRIVPVTHKEANEFVARLHRHNKPTLGYRFCVGCADTELRGVSIVGHPVARHLDDGLTVEIRRVCTDGTRNACSMLYGASRRVAKELGYSRVITYTLPEEGGASLRASGFILDSERSGGPCAGWNKRTKALGQNVGAEPVGNDLIGGKLRWVAYTRKSA